MESNMADFVGMLGPGQIIDRYSIVMLPSGFVKVILYNNKSNLFVCVSEFKETYEDHHSLNIKMSVKGFLTIDGHVIEGYPITSERIHSSAANRDFQVLKFDKCFLGKLRGSQGSSDKATDEILQICIHGVGKRHRQKSLIGMLHIAIGNTDSSESLPYTIEAWYKIFPRSSFLAGYPIGGATNHHVNPPSPIPSPLSEESDDLVSVFRSLSCESAHDDANASSPTSNISNGLSRNTSFSQMAGLMVKLIQKKKDAQRNMETRCSSSFCSSSSLHESCKSRPSVTNSVSVASQSGDSASDKKSTSFDDIEISDERKCGKKKSRKLKILKKFSFSKSKQKNVTKIQRSEEIICVSSAYEWQYPTTITESPDEHSNAHVRDSLHGIKVLGTETLAYRRANLRQNRKLHSVESDSVDFSSQETEENSTSSSFEKLKHNGSDNFKVIPSMMSWMRTVQEKAKSRSLPLNSTQPRTTKRQSSFKTHARTPEEPDAIDPDYAFLKGLQSFRQRSKTVGSKGKTDKEEHSTDSRSESLSEESNTPSSVILKEQETKPHIAPEIIESLEPVTNEINPTRCENGDFCKRKRSLFSKRRGSAFESNIVDDVPDRSKLSVSSCIVHNASRRSSLRIEYSDDEYLTCSERTSCSNLSSVSLYSTASEASQL